MQASSLPSYSEGGLEQDMNPEGIDYNFTQEQDMNPEGIDYNFTQAYPNHNNSCYCDCECICEKCAKVLQFMCILACAALCVLLGAWDNN